MSYLASTVYGIIQAFCEFLPISSSGHLALLPTFLSIEDPGVIFDLFMHIGTSLALIVYFRKEILELLAETLTLNLKSRSGYAFHFWLTTISSIVFILMLKPITEAFGRNNLLIGINLIVFGALLYFFDKKSSEKYNSPDLFQSPRWKLAILMGLSQAIAIFPGVSRSGATITCGRMLGMTRGLAARYSFLMSVPVILIGALYKSLKVLKGEEVLPGVGVTLWGVFISFFLGILVIHYFLKFINRFPFLYFFLYRTLIGIIVLVMFFK
ncbi:MAG: undecaprenyl-diphosphate phosphatase [Halobacteriovoraceae bacterium]|nr:undecaprenyl-diphosphate phosphatase [Halobacteriovoraceae bacterium]MCB9093648.1 undecaprenyl-diphosphate phosphatase [Halobacteriovoraceae bacterium]